MDDLTLQAWIEGRIPLAQVKDWQSEEYQLFMMLGFTLYEQGRSQEATIIFEGLLSLDPRNAYCHSALGAAYLRLGQDEKALSHFNMALQLDPRDVSAYINRGELFMRQKNYRQAQADLEMSLKIGSNLGIRSQTLRRAQGLLNTARRRQIEDP
jgi:Flp pilus assembly protein TadD